MDTPDIALIGGAGGGLAALAALGRWAVGLWATVRREGMEATKVLAERQIAAAAAAAALARADNERMVGALLESAKAQTSLAGKIDQLPEMLALVIAEARNQRSEPFERPEREVTPQSIPIRASTASEASERRRRRRVRTPPHGSGTD
jgi:hypothetical protein